LALAQVRNRRDTQGAALFPAAGGDFTTDELGSRTAILRRLCGQPIKSTPQRRILKDAQHRSAYIEEAYVKAHYAATCEQEDAFL
jgi:hypothetical protein